MGSTSCLLNSRVVPSIIPKRNMNMVRVTLKSLKVTPVQACLAGVKPKFASASLNKSINCLILLDLEVTKEIQ